jgi:hypothetical protein
MTTLNLQIVAGADDGIAVDVLTVLQTFDNTADGAVGHDDTTQAPFTTNYYPFWRFVSVTIPQGATINSATLGLTQASAVAYGSANATIYGNDVDNAAQPSTYANVASMTQTSANTSANISSAATKSYNVASIIQEIINRGSWVSGNALMLAMFPDTGSLNLSDSWWGYDNDPLQAATLDIDYTSGSPPTTNGMLQLF